MGLFKKKEKVVDWSEKYKIQTARSSRTGAQSSGSSSSSDKSGLGFLGDMANSNSSTDNVSWDNDSSSNSSYGSDTVGNYSDKKQKLAKRLLDMTGKIEELSNQIYHLKQRIEVLEKKARISFE